MDYNISYIQNIVQDLGLHEDINISESEIDEYIGKICDKYDFSYSTGISKLVIKPKDTDYVIKIPFSTYYDEETDSFYSFHCYGYRGWGWNACEFEEELYSKAYDAKFEQFFLPIEFVGAYNNYPIYVQPKVNVIYESRDDFCYLKPTVKTNKILDDNYIDTMSKLVEGWFDIINQELGEERFSEFLHFLNKYDISSDLHEGNIGIYQGKPVIIDYAGFERNKEEKKFVLV